MKKAKNDIEETKKQLAYYFQELSYGVTNTKIQFRDKDELINFAILDLITTIFHQLEKSSMDRFIANLNAIKTGLEKFKRSQP